MANIMEAGKHGQHEQGNGQLGLHREKLLHGGILLLQVLAELLEDDLEADPGCAKELQPLLIIPGGLDVVQPPVLASWVGPQVMGLEAQEHVDGPSGTIQECVICVPPGVQVAT
ncbi:hypothetical protein Y1Q_0004831 [Alligator mississippiensis]|uniref:Uncharacterized protein n=1 Tax=Alligator mississippiensis TaxID=8496 RepID=A0A151NQZ0_ALLMI|nr:hypothetical protein Y1Q_0004831 [Alligator mississippiensis]